MLGPPNLKLPSFSFVSLEILPSQDGVSHPGSVIDGNIVTAGLDVIYGELKAEEISLTALSLPYLMTLPTSAVM